MPPTLPLSPGARDDLARIGAAVREARHARDWSLREASAAAGVWPSAWHRVELARPVSLPMLLRVAGALGLRVELR